MPILNKKSFVACFLLALTLICFYDVVFLGRTFKVTTANSQALPTGAYGQANNKPSFIPVNGTDSPVLEEPIYEFIKQNLRKGIFPLWNPHQACGYPLFGMIQVGILSPLNLIMYLLPEVWAWDALILSRFFLAGILVYWLMRALGFSGLPAMISGVSFMLSGPMLLLQYWTVNVDLLAPVYLIAAERLVRRANRLHLACLALVICLTILGGHPEHIFLVNAFGVCFFVHRLMTTRKPARPQKTIFYFFLSYLLGLALSAVVLLPFLQQLATEFWHGHPQGVGLKMEEQAGRALTLLLPHFFQEVPLTYRWEFSGWWGGYIGTLPFVLAAFSLFRNQKKGLNYFFAAIAFVLIGKQYGLPLINLIGHLPGFSMIRYAIHGPHLVALNLSILAGMGTRFILTDRTAFKKGLLLYTGILLTAAGHLVYYRQADFFPLAVKAVLFAGGLLTLLLSILWLKDHRRISLTTTGLLLLGLLTIELFCYIHRERPRRFSSFGKVPYIEALRSSPQRIRSYGNFWAFYPNTATGFEVDDLGYFFGLVPKRFVTFVNTLLVKDHFRNDLRPPALRAIPIQNREAMLDLLNIKHIIAPDTDRLSSQFKHFQTLDEKYKLVYSNEVKVYERPSAFPRAFIVHRVLFEQDEQKTLALVYRIGQKLRQVVVINAPTDPRIVAGLKDSPASDNSWARITSYEANTVKIQANMEHPGFLILGDSFHPGWTARVNGKPGEVFQADYLLRAVFLPGGKHQVEFIFRPFTFSLGVGISLLAIVVLLALILPLRKRPSP